MRYLIVFLLIFAISQTARANVSVNKNMDLCKSATHQSERQFNIPRNLLRAISLTESGRWVEKDKANIAWPWTVASGSAGKFFQTKSEAIQHVRALQAQGIKNIDVGCMQINLRYHPDAFKDLHEAFDPHSNTRYAGEFLSKLFKNTKSWSTAAGHYHSNDPSKNMYYREKVLGFWNYANREPQDTHSNPKSYKVAQIDNRRTELLNNNFKKRLSAQRAAITRSEKMSAQISDWRDNRRLSKFGQVNAAKNRALYQQKEKKRLMVPNNTSTTRGLKQQRDFSNRRSAQLDKWRKTVALPEYVSSSSRTTQPSTLLDR
ncbi:transglycosylase SLT domain-containing protein [Terasakiella sp. A23]|uniref:transglycosylase SLT domain-containing protein n=1 Tax=Terasakiella sp. FCG-A23 TaxID=3080561 RepID=UPI00295590F0|nr:transglycosylase SLT domain-containing protein [Terasakiella sp. A23]MDV7340662.1 transglycosylase SLT domain-containing protein [Terasakiella sp. A23]